MFVSIKKRLFYVTSALMMMAHQQSVAQSRNEWEDNTKERAASTASAQVSAIDIYLVQGHRYPLCRAIVTALRGMPPSTEMSTWPGHLAFSIRGVEQPRWSSLDPMQYLPELRTFLLTRVHPGWLARPTADDATWAEMAGKTEQRIVSGEIRMEETLVRGVKLGVPSQVSAVPEWVSDIHFLRIGLADLSVGTIGLTDLSTPSQRPTITSWGYIATSLSVFPAVHDVVVANGLTGFEMVLVEGQPWFIGASGLVATPFTSDLGLSGPNQPHGIGLDQKCLIHFPTKLANGTIR